MRIKEKRRSSKKAKDYTNGATWAQTEIPSDFSR